MTPRSQVEIAEQIARQAHAGQLDRAGRPYIEHVERVAAGVTAPDAPIAWLHDVIERTPFTAADLAAAGIEPQVIAAVEAISRGDEEEADHYYERVSANAAALRVKVSDLADNSSEMRLGHLDDELRAQLLEKYAHAREALGLTVDA